ncbi:polysaccharide biosynthesis protein [Fredinandcohnia sp. QZ13]|uniref:putative polysaccharide biosynthesis protein n=1 Tax=Fredinandcohnia sp. QZ13 TaxID=3073144 RepID=UPI0028530D68|nr:polysaccharide biosynthesis protein [Fredinandcohnia sp. QZ13]MDR4889296.1 polysaccharide biosynthesis protein [Fredinandcohnia sp. QZ13]
MADSNSKLLRGTFVLTLATYISRVLGMIYVFPFVYLVGDIGSALYSYGYAQYTIFLFISTAGIPAAVSKFVSKYNSLGDYHTGMRMYKSGLIVMGLTGLLGFTILNLLAPILAPIVLGGEDAKNTVDDVTYVIRMVSFALLVVPIMSIQRGFFQGHQSMGPTAVSQVVEQIVRILFVLSATFIVMQVMAGERVFAVGLATFGAFIGALGGLAVLIWYWFKRKPYLDEMLAKSRPQTDMTTKEMFKELFSYAGPFVLVGLSIPLYQYVDQLTFNRTMIENGFDKDVSEGLFSYVTFMVPKLVMIPVSLATAFSLTLVPTITNSFTSGDFKLLRSQIDKTFQICVLLVLPAVVGLSVLAYPTFNALFEMNEAGGRILRWYAPVAILFSFYSISAAILQGINKQKFAVVSLFMGLILKISFNSLFITWFGEIGSILATALGYTIAIAYCFWMISRHAGYSYSLFARRTLLMAIFAAVMALTILLIEWLLSFIVGYENGRLQSVFVLLVGVAVGAVAYLYLAYRSRLLEALIGNRFSFLSRNRKKAVQ